MLGGKHLKIYVHTYILERTQKQNFQYTYIQSFSVHEQLDSKHLLGFALTLYGVCSYKLRQLEHVRK